MTLRQLLQLHGAWIERKMSEDVDWDLEAYKQGTETLRSIYDYLFSLTRTSVGVNAAGGAVAVASSLLRLSNSDPDKPILAHDFCAKLEEKSFAEPSLIEWGQSLVFVEWFYLLGWVFLVFGIVLNLGAGCSQHYLRQRVINVAQGIINLEHARKIQHFTNSIQFRHFKPGTYGGSDSTIKAELKSSYAFGPVYFLTLAFFFLACVLWVIFGCMIISVGCNPL